MSNWSKEFQHRTIILRLSQKYETAFLFQGSKSNRTKGGGGYNEIVAIDAKGNELMRFHAQKDMDTVSAALRTAEAIDY